MLLQVYDVKLLSTQVDPFMVGLQCYYYFLLQKGWYCGLELPIIGENLDK